jgi:hypothetical protein
MTPVSPLCSEKQRLINEYVTAVSKYHRLETLQVEALLTESGLTLEAEVESAREERDCAKAAITAHRKEHGC